MKLKRKWKTYRGLSANSNKNDDANSNDIDFTIKDTKVFVSVVTLL